MSERCYKRRTVFIIRDDDLHLQLERESAYVLRSVIIQSDQITGMSINFLSCCSAKTNHFFFFSSFLK